MGGAFFGGQNFCAAKAATASPELTRRRERAEELRIVVLSGEE